LPLYEISTVLLAAFKHFDLRLIDNQPIEPVIDFTNEAA
jgi:hypothetical protein